MGALGAGNVLSNVISGGFWLLIAFLLGAGEYGTVSYFVAIAAFASIVASLGSNNVVVVLTSKGSSSLSAIYFLALLSGVVTSIVLYFLFSNIGVSLYVIGFIVFHLALSHILGKQLYGLYSKMVFLQRVLSVGLGLLLYYFVGPQGIILGIALSFFPFVTQVYRIFDTDRLNFSGLRARSRNILSNYSIEITKNFSFSADKFFIMPMFGFVTLGHYQLAVQLLLALITVPYIAYLYTLPHDARGNANATLKKWTFIVAVALCLLVITLSPILIPIVLPQYIESIDIIRITSIGIIPISINTIYYSKLVGQEKNKLMIISSLIFVVTHVGGIYFLGNMFGINGAAAAIVVAATVESLYLLSADRPVLRRVS